MNYLYAAVALYVAIGIGFAFYMRSPLAGAVWPLWVLFAIFGNIQ